MEKEVLFGRLAIRQLADGGNRAIRFTAVEGNPSAQERGNTSKIYLEGVVTIQ